MDQQTQPEKASRDNSSQKMASHSASTGRYQGVAALSATQIDTGARDVEEPIMGLKAALEHRSYKPLTPYRKEVWAEQLHSMGLEDRYPQLIQSLTEGFDLGILNITSTYTSTNYALLRSLEDVCSKIINSEFTAGRYIGPFTQHQLELELGPFQLSPLSLVPKKSSLDAYRAIHNFSHPHNCITHPPTPLQSIPTSMATISPAPGAHFQPLPYSLLASPQAHKPLSAML